MTAKITPTGFLVKLNTQKAMKSAAGFIQAHREYLTTGELAAETAQIVSRFEAGMIPATPALDLIRDAVIAHTLKRSEKVEKAEKEPSEPRSSSKHYAARIIDAATGETATEQVEVAETFKDKDGNEKTRYVLETKKLAKCFALPQEAQRWADRRLVDGSPSWYATVTQTNAVHKDHAVETIERDDSIARLLGKPRMPVTKSVQYGGSKIGWEPKCSQSVAKFSRG
jgi:hypothetical protein